MSFKLADGYVITVKGGWRGTEAEQGFLREVFLGACQRFTTVLAPGSNVFHYDHIHVDLARHDPRGLKRICQPLIKFTPQLGSDNPRPMSRPRPPERQPAPPQAPVDIEEDDPYGAAPMSRAASPTQVARAPARPTAPSAYASAPDAAPAARTTRPPVSPRRSPRRSPTAASRSPFRSPRPACPRGRSTERQRPDDCALRAPHGSRKRGRLDRPA